MATADTDFSPLGYGLGLRAPHIETILATRPPVDWFEILSENFMHGHPGHREMLSDLRARYPLVMHGVALNIASTDPIDRTYLAALKALAATVRPVVISDHLSWTALDGTYSHDLLPVPYTEEAFRHIAPRIMAVQDALGQALVIENTSSYARFRSSSMTEAEFMARLCEQTGCGILLDVNNVYISAFNHGYDAQAWLSPLPFHRIAYLHLAGHQHQGTHLMDTHDRAVADEVWALYRRVRGHMRGASVMVEWDSDIPALNVMLAELDKARACDSESV